MVRKLMFAFRYLKTFFIKRFGIIFRALICLGFGAFILKNDEATSYDQRFNFRGSQPMDSRIVQIKIQESDLKLLKGWSRNQIIPLKEIFETSDRLYWDPELWAKILTELLLHEPAKIGVSLVFTPQQLNELTQFKSEKIVWASTPGEASSFNRATVEVLRDEDGVVRRVKSTEPHFIEAMTGTQFLNSSLFINYRAPSEAIPTYSITDLLSKDLSRSEFKDKFVLIGIATPLSQKLVTPPGKMDLVDVLAQGLDNQLNDRWITRSPPILLIGYLVFILLSSVIILVTLPQSISFALLCWLSLLTLAMSAWIFDTFAIWVPAATPALQILFTWILFVGHQVNQLEKNQWLTIQEKKLNEEFDQLKNNFISLISHDLKTPIAKIQGITDRLLTTQKDNALSTDLKTLSRTGEELNRYIQSILKVLRVEARDFKIQKEIADLNETALEAIGLLRELAQEKNVILKEDFEPLFALEFDAPLIREVCLNLIDNAIKYTSPGGTVTVRTREDLNQVFFEVEDSGEGIPPEELDQVWGKFVRGKSQDLKTKGTGLGLYLVKYFVELHGGSVFIKSELKKGTTVSFSLPLDS